MGDTTFGSLLVELGLVNESQLREATDRSADSISDALLALGHVTHPQLKQALDAVASPTRPRLGEVLVELEHLTPQRLEEVLKLQSAEQRPLGELLVEHGDLTYEQVFEGLQVQSSSTPSRTRVLLVYDSTIMCTTLTRGLTELGYDVMPFDNPVRALAELPILQPDIVITELEMPVLDGAELCRRIKQSAQQTVPVIILTGNEHSTAVGGLQAGADDYLRKHTSMKELAARIDGILRRTSATSRMHRLFARYTSDAVVEQLLQGGDVVLAGEKLEVTVLFADVRNFTQFSETHPPERVVKTLNDILSRLTDAVLAQGGTIDKFLGDGLMAVFGAPMKTDDHARRGLAAAHGIQHAMDARNRDCRSDEMLEVGVAVNTGVVVAGSIGNERRTEYTCIGDPVNVASRLCSIAERGEILVGEGTVARIGDPRQFEEGTPVFLKGKAQRVSVFRAKRNQNRRTGSFPRPEDVDSIGHRTGSFPRQEEIDSIGHRAGSFPRQEEVDAIGHRTGSFPRQEDVGAVQPSGSWPRQEDADGLAHRTGPWPRQDSEPGAVRGSGPWPRQDDADASGSIQRAWSHAEELDMDTVVDPDVESTG